MAKKKVTYIISNISKIIAIEWVCTYMEQDDIEFSFIFLNTGNSEIEEFAKQHGYEFLRVKYSGKKDLVKSVFKVMRFLWKNKVDVVHCHLIDASFIGLLAAKLARVKKRIYTRHHSTLHHEYYPNAVKFDRMMNALSTDIVAISNNVKKVLVEKEKVPEHKVALIHHGFLIDEFANVSESRIQRFKDQYAIQAGNIVVGVVSRYTLWKGVQYVIPAFLKLLKFYPNAILLLANGHGDDETYIRELLRSIPEANFIEVKYERDMGALYKSLDIYVHTPIDEHCEAFGQTYVEALMAKVPSVFTLSGIATEFIKNNVNAVVVGYKNEDETFEGMRLLLDNQNVANEMARQGYMEVVQKFNLSGMIAKLKKLYMS